MSRKRLAPARPRRSAPPARPAVGVCLALLLATSPAPAPAGEASREPSRQLLQRYVDDYAHDPTLRQALSFGVEIDGEWWTVEASPGAGGPPHEVLLSEGPPAQPTFYFKVDRETLDRLDRGEMSPGTAMSGSREERLMSVDGMEGYAPGPDGVAPIFSAAFHFWMRGNPEIYRFRELATLPRHGAQVGIIFYQPGFRSGWVSIQPGEHANADPEEQANPFPSLFIFVNGRGKARIGGREVVIEGDSAVIVPAGVTHEFWNPFDEPLEGFMLAFGEGA